MAEAFSFQQSAVGDQLVPPKSPYQRDFKSRAPEIAPTGDFEN